MINYNVKQEKGGITIFVLLTCLFFTFILSGIYISNLNKLQVQERQIQNIQNNYARDMENIDTYITEKKKAGLQTNTTGATRVKIEEGKYVVVPAGATISKIPGEYESIDNGVVMYITGDNQITDWNADINANNILDVQENYDQFVWIPVQDPVLDLSTIELTDEQIKTSIQEKIEKQEYPMAIKNSTGNYIGILYDFNEEIDEQGKKIVKVSVSETDWLPLNTTASREPSISINYDKADYIKQITGITGATYSDSQEFNMELQTYYDEMIEKIIINGGFWVGRYETGGMKNDTTITYDGIENQVKVTVRKGQEPREICNVSWWRMYGQQQIYASKNLTSSSETISSMIWGSQWDQIMIWMRNEVNTLQNSNYIVNSIGLANYGTIAGVNDGASNVEQAMATGCHKVKNIYDLAGNVSEWTLECYSTDNRIARGGYYATTNTLYTNAKCREQISLDESYEYIGTRLSIY